MTGTRLEIRANVVSALAPHVQNLEKTTEMAKVDAHTLVPAVLASAKAVLRENQIENGVAVIDIGGSTTSVAVFEEGDLQFVGVIPMGGINITNDLAIGLKTDPEVAEEVKLKHAVAEMRSENSGISLKLGEELHSFSTSEIDEIVDARLEELFEAINKELKKAGRAGKLPSGVVLTGGGANMKKMAEYSKEKLGLAARVGKPSGFGGVAESAEQPEYAAAVGLMLIDSEGAMNNRGGGKSKARAGGSVKLHSSAKKASNAVSSFLGKFKV